MPPTTCPTCGRPRHRELPLLIGALGLLLGLLAAEAFGQTPRDVPKEAQYEIARRGAAIERVDGFEAAHQAAQFEAFSIPPDDSHKFRASLIVQREDPTCEQLRADIAGAPALKHWIDVADYQASYLHFQTYQADDTTQDYRWKQLRQDFAKAGFPFRLPLLIVTPPHNGAYGDPRNVVFAKSGYNSKPEELDQQLRAAIADYARRVEPQHAAWKQQQAVRLAAGFRAEEQDRNATPEEIAAALEQLGADRGADRNCPFPVCPPLGPPMLTQAPLIPPPAAAQPPAAPSSNFALWTTLVLGGLGLGGTNLLGVGLAVWGIVRKTRQAAGQPVLPETVYHDLTELVRSLKAKQQ